MPFETTDHSLNYTKLTHIFCKKCICELFFRGRFSADRSRWAVGIRQRKTGVPAEAQKAKKPGGHDCRGLKAQLIARQLSKRNWI